MSSADSPSIRTAVEQLSQATGVEASFFSGGLLLASSLKPELEKQVSAVGTPAANHPEEPFKLRLAGNRISPWCATSR
jgi:hypothetical protein